MKCFFHFQCIAVAILLVAFAATMSQAQEGDDQLAACRFTPPPDEEQADSGSGLTVRLSSGGSRGRDRLAGSGLFRPRPRPRRPRLNCDYLWACTFRPFSAYPTCSYAYVCRDGPTRLGGQY